MQTKVLLGSRWLLILLVVVVLGGLSWLNGDPIGNAGAWLMVVLAVGWSTVLSGRGCAARLRKQEDS
ncbi:MAG: hypothetical protein M3P92_12695 [Actinomycetota bacterium]|nr:hypothetical protein [Actinomycetota bacterium]